VESQNTVVASELSAAFKSDRLAKPIAVSLLSETRSEIAFCYVLMQIEKKYRESKEVCPYMKSPISYSGFVSYKSCPWAFRIVPTYWGL